MSTDRVDTGTPETTWRIVAFSGSLRAASSNTGLVRLAQRVAPETLDIHFVDWIDQLPFYNSDLEADLPPLVSQWRQLVTDADALLIGMPEYNWGPSALAKNAIDWLTRPPGQHALRGKIIAMVTSGGKTGGRRVQEGLTHILDALGNIVLVEPEVHVALGASRIAVDGQTDDIEIIELVTAKMAALAQALADQQVVPDA